MEGLFWQLSSSVDARSTKKPPNDKKVGIDGMLRFPLQDTFIKSDQKVSFMLTNPI